MKKKLLSLTLSALLLCSTGVIASAKTIDNTNQATASIDEGEHIHCWLKAGFYEDGNGTIYTVLRCKYCGEIMEVPW